MSALSARLSRKEDRGTAVWYGIFCLWYGWSCLCLNTLMLRDEDLTMHMIYVNLSASALLAAYTAVYGRYSRRELLAAAAATAVIAASALVQKDGLLLAAWMVVISARGRGEDRLLKTAGAIALTVGALTVLLGLAGIAPDAGVARNGVLRNSLGFNHPNMTGAWLQLMAALALYLRGEKFGLPDVLLSLAAAVLIWAVPNSRSSAVCVVLLAAVKGWVCLSARLPEALRRAGRYCFATSAVLCNAGSVLLSLLYRPEGFFLKLDSILNLRLSFANAMYKAVGISLLGSPVPDVDGEAVIVDNSYMHILLHFGLLAWLVFSAFLIWCMFRLVRRRRDLLLGFLAVYNIYAMMEKSLLEPRYCAFLLLLVPAAFPAADAFTRTNTQIDGRSISNGIHSL